MNRIRELWNARSRREQVMLLVLAAVLTGMIGWLATWGLLDWREDARGRAQRAASDHALVLAGAAMAAPAQAGTPPGGLEALVRQSAASQGLEPLTATQDGALAVSFETAASPALFGWLAHLESQGVRVRSFTALKTPEGGLQARVILAPPA